MQLTSSVNGVFLIVPTPLFDDGAIDFDSLD